MNKTKKDSFAVVGFVTLAVIVAMLAAILISTLGITIESVDNATILEEARRTYAEYVSVNGAGEASSDSGWVAVVIGRKSYYVEVIDGEVQEESVYPQDKKGKRIITWNDHNRHAYSNGFCVCGAVNLRDVTVHDSLVAYEHTLNEQDHTVLLTKYIGGETDITVPDMYVIKGVKYRPVLDSATVFAGNTAINSVTICYGAGYKDNSMKAMFDGCSGLRSVDLSDADTFSVVSMRALFYDCKSLETLDLHGMDTASLKDIGYMFSGSSYGNMPKKLKTIDLSSWDLSRVINSSCCFQRCQAQTILLPDSLAVMGSFFFNHTNNVNSESFTIPAGARKIGLAHATYNFATDGFKEFKVADGNGYYKTLDGILYSIDGASLIAIPKGKTFEGNTFTIPEGVTFLGELSFSRNQNIHTVVIPNSFEIEYVEVGDEDYKLDQYDGGNLNGGNNLSVAVYYYCENLSRYEVKESNTRYTATDGIIYSKDATEVVAIPARYQGKIVIPEGVTDWKAGAFYVGYGDEGDNNTFANKVTLACTGVHIPSSLTSMEEKELLILNWIVDQYIAGNRSEFIITVAEGNTAFAVDESGHLMRTK